MGTTLIPFEIEHSIGVTIFFQRRPFPQETAIKAGGVGRITMNSSLFTIARKHELHILSTFEEDAWVRYRQDLRRSGDRFECMLWACSMKMPSRFRVARFFDDTSLTVFPATCPITLL